MTFEYVWPYIMGLVFIWLISISGYGIYSDHQYKMKKLELIEKGLLKEEK